MIRYPTKRRVDVQDHILEEWPGVRRFAELLDQTCRESKARFEKLNPKTVETR